MAALGLAGCGPSQPSGVAALLPSAPVADRPPASARAERIVDRASPAPSLPPVASVRQRGAPNRLVSADGTLDVLVGSYGDCTGASPISADHADLDSCFPGRAYFVGHSPGAFSPLLHMHAGAEITWFDAEGNANRFRIVAERDFRRNSGWLSLARPDVAAQFQTCLTADGALDLILDAVRV